MKKMKYIGKSIMGGFAGVETLTNGNIYEVEDLNNSYYKLKDDNGYFTAVSKEKFKEI